MTRHTPSPTANAQDVTAIVMSLPVTARIQIALGIVRSRGLNDMDGDELDRAECALCSLLSQSREDDYYEDRALHGGLVAA